MTDVADTLRDKDVAVLRCIQNGEQDVQQITAATTLSNSEVNYSFGKLEDHDLITVEKPDGMVDRVVNGQRQVFEAPKQASLTDRGQSYLASIEFPGEQYQDMSREELVESVHELEIRISDLEDAFEAFRQQVLQKLD